MSDLEQSRRLAARVEPFIDVLDVRLFNVSAQLIGFPSESEPLTWRLVVAPSVKYERGDDVFIIEGIFEIAVVRAAPTSDPEVKIASIKFDYSGMFSLDLSESEPDPAELDAYAKTTGLVVLMPYAREFTQSMTSRMGLMPLTLGQLHPDQLMSPEIIKKRASRSGR